MENFHGVPSCPVACPVAVDLRTNPTLLYLPIQSILRMALITNFQAGQVIVIAMSRSLPSLCPTTILAVQQIMKKKNLVPSVFLIPEPSKINSGMHLILGIMGQSFL